MACAEHYAAEDGLPSLPGARVQAEVDARWEGCREEIRDISRRQYLHCRDGGTDLVTPWGDLIPPVTLRGKKERNRFPPVDPEPVDFFFVWPPVPAEYEGRKRPVLLLLHGATGSKDELGLQCMGSQLWFLHRLAKELVVVIPQCPSRAKRPWVAAPVRATLLYAMEQAVRNGGDPDRMYVTGLSMGGTASWELAMDSAEGRAPFAAAVAVCGMVLNLHRLPTLVNFPIWVFHGSNDSVFPVEGDDQAVNAVLTSGANKGEEPTLYYTRYEWSPAGDDPFGTGSMDETLAAPGHAAWEQAYADEEMWTWLLSQRRRPPEPRLPAPLGGKSLPGSRPQGEVDARLEKVEETMRQLMHKQQQIMLVGGKELVVLGTTPVPPVQIQGEPDRNRKWPLEPEPLDFFFVWPPKPANCPEKRPALVFLHGGFASQDEGGLMGLAENCWWLHLVPQEMVVIIPHARSRKYHWLLRSVKATIVCAVEKAVALGVDPDRVYVTGLSMGGTGAWEYALLSAEGNMPFAAAAPVTPYVMSIPRARLLADFPMWLFYGSNEWQSLVNRVDDAVACALDSGANRQETTLLCTKYAWSPDTGDPQLASPMNDGHGTYKQAYGEPDLFSWLMQHRRRQRLEGPEPESLQN